MISIYVTIITLASTALAKGSIECSFSGPSGVRQCFGEVGQPLIFHLSNSKNPDITLQKDNKYRILKVRKNDVTVHQDYVNPTESFTNGILNLGNAKKRHSGNYLLEEFGPNGGLLRTANVHLEIHAPVSKPAVSQVCLSPEQMNISCSSEGNRVEFELTLDGILLIQTRGHSLSLSNGSNENEDESSYSKVTISLSGHLIGNLRCLVWNNVSRDESVVPLTSCKDFSSFPVVPVAVTATFLTLLLLVALCLSRIMYNKNKQRPTTAGEGNCDTEIIYSNVRVTPKPRN